MLTVDSALSIVFENSFNIGLENQGKVGNFGFIIAFRSVSFLSLSFFFFRQTSETFRRSSKPVQSVRVARRRLLHLDHLNKLITLCLSPSHV